MREFILRSFYNFLFAPSGRTYSRQKKTYHRTVTLTDGSNDFNEQPSESVRPQPETVYNPSNRTQVQTVSHQTHSWNTAPVYNTYRSSSNYSFTSGGIHSQDGLGSGSSIDFRNRNTIDGRWNQNSEREREAARRLLIEERQTELWRLQRENEIQEQENRLMEFRNRETEHVSSSGETVTSSTTRPPFYWDPSPPTVEFDENSRSQFLTEQEEPGLYKVTSKSNSISPLLKSRNEGNSKVYTTKRRKSSFRKTYYSYPDPSGGNRALNSLYKTKKLKTEIGKRKGGAKQQSEGDEGKSVSTYAFTGAGTEYADGTELTDGHPVLATITVNQGRALRRYMRRKRNHLGEEGNRG